MTIGNKKGFTLSLLLFLCMEGVLLSLAHWQFLRMEEKETLINELNQSISHNIQPYTKSLKPAKGSKIHLHGRFDGSRAQIWENQLLDGKPGWRILVPFITEQGTEIIVDRGFTKRVPPSEVPPLLNSMTDGNHYQITGLVRYPKQQEGIIKGPKKGNMERSILFLDLDLFPMADELKREPFYVVSLTGTHPKLTAKAWINGFGPETHRGYMLTWALLAAILPFFYAVFARRFFKKG